jgi:hypothetical protein
MGEGAGRGLFGSNVMKFVLGLQRRPKVGKGSFFLLLSNAFACDEYYRVSARIRASRA